MKRMFLFLKPPIENAAHLVSVHRYFIDHTIRAEQEDYETEEVEWEHVEYFNNKVHT